MKTAALYARTSTTKSEQSIPHQLKLMQDFCKREGYKVVEKYQEQQSAWNDKERPVFKRMIAVALSKEKPYSAILTLTSDRFSRNVQKARFFKSSLRKVGVDVIAITQPIPKDDPTGMVMEVIQEAFAQYQSEMLSIRVLSAMLENARQGFYCGGSRPKYGFETFKVTKAGDKTKSRIKVNKEEARIIKRIFNFYLQGMGSKLIASKLYSSGTSYRGANWNTNRILSILSEESYRGKYLYNQFDKNKRPKDRAEWVEIEIDRIVDDELNRFAELFYDRLAELFPSS